MIVIVEGIDKVGKTYLIDEFRRRRKCIIIKNQHIPETSDDKLLKESYLSILAFLRKYHDKFTIILDRSYPSQLVYSILEKYDSMDDEWYKDYEEVLRELNHIYVYCENHANVLRERHENKKDNYISINQINTLLFRYNKFYQRTTLNKIKLNLEPEEHFEDSLNKLLDIVK